MDGRDGSGGAKALFVQLALLAFGALLEDFDHSILFQELSVENTNP